MRRSHGAESRQKFVSLNPGFAIGRLENSLCQSSTYVKTTSFQRQVLSSIKAAIVAERISILPYSGSFLFFWKFGSGDCAVRLSVPGRPTGLDKSRIRPSVLAASEDGIVRVFNINYHIFSFFPLSFSSLNLKPPIIQIKTRPTAFVFFQ